MWEEEGNVEVKVGMEGRSKGKILEALRRRVRRHRERGKGRMR